MNARRLFSCCLVLTILAFPTTAAAAGRLETKLSALSESGSGEAAYHLGMLFHVGLSEVRKDPKRAFELFRLSAERGDPLGAYKYGCYFDGQGEGVVESDPKQALKYKLVAAEAGYALAQEDVAKHFFAEGDTAEGLRWLESAAAQGNPMSLMVLGTLYSGQAPEGFPKLPADKARSWKYMLLATREIPEVKRKFASEARKDLGDQEFKRVTAEVAAWREIRTPLTRKADEGIGAAYTAAGLRVPSN